MYKLLETHTQYTVCQPHSTLNYSGNTSSVTPQITLAFTSYTPQTSFKENDPVSVDLFGAIRQLRIVKVFIFRNDHGTFETSVDRLSVDLA
jgi:hypothetical protein